MAGKKHFKAEKIDENGIVKSAIYRTAFQNTRVWFWSIWRTKKGGETGFVKVLYLNPTRQLLTIASCGPHGEGCRRRRDIEIHTFLATHGLSDWQADPDYGQLPLVTAPATSAPAIIPAPAKSNARKDILEQALDKVDRIVSDLRRLLIEKSEQPELHPDIVLEKPDLDALFEVHTLLEAAVGREELAQTRVIDFMRSHPEVPSKDVASLVRIPIDTVKAWKAHITMGTYGDRAAE